MGKLNAHIPKSTSDGDAEFLGYQLTKDGRTIPLYNITVENHPLRGSTVTEKSLRALKLRIPRIPEENIVVK